MRNRVARTDTKIPLLGDIPVLGALFRSTSTTLQKSNLILVLTPYIIREQDDLRTVFERKMQERQEFLDHYFVFSDRHEYEPPRTTRAPTASWRTSGSRTPTSKTSDGSRSSRVRAR